MSYKIIDRIKKLKCISGKHKRVLEAWASFANKEGRNIFCSKETAAGRAGVSRDTIYRNTDELLELGLMVEAQSHTCRVENCNKGRTHFTGQWGHYTIAYNIEVSNSAILQNVERYLSAKHQKVSRAKRRKVNVAKPDAILPKEESAALTRHPIDHSVIEHHGKEDSEEARKRQGTAVEPRGEETPMVNHSGSGSYDPMRERRRAAWEENLAGDTGVDEEFDGGMDMWSLMNQPSPDYVLPRSNRTLDSEEWFTADTLYREVFNTRPMDQVPRGHILEFAEVCLDISQRTGYAMKMCALESSGEWPEMHPVRDFMSWNQAHKTGGMIFANGGDMSRAYFSASERNARWQWQNHDPDTCPKCIRRAPRPEGMRPAETS